MDIGEPPEAGPAGLSSRLSRCLTLDTAERNALAELHLPLQRIARRRDLVREGNEYPGVFVLCEGVVSRYRVLPDGRRQVLDFATPGDVIGFPASLLPRATASACCITDAAVVPVSFERLAQLFSRFPRLGAALAWAAARGAAIAAERLVAVGRRSAEERMAYLLLELWVLCHDRAPVNGDRLRFPLTQELIADALGLSTPHVNRTLRKLRERRLLAMYGQEAWLIDARGLIMLACFDPAHFAVPAIPGW